MTPRQARTALARTYAHAGFAPQGDLLVHCSPTLVHAVQLLADRRSPGLAHLAQRVHVLTEGAHSPENFDEYTGLTADIYSYESAYPNSWHFDRLNLERAPQQSIEPEFGPVHEP